MMIAHLPACIKDRDVRLRHVRISDGPGISELLEHDDILTSSGINTPRRTQWLFFYCWLRKTFFAAYFIELKKEKIGFIGLYNLAPGESAEISLIVFDPSFRRRGYGTLAFKMLSQNPFTAAFANTFIVRVRTDNEPARSFWRKLGFETVRVEGDTIEMRLRKADYPAK
jgi:RimJ/RimL family protein N-acetyltransferase